MHLRQNIDFGRQRLILFAFFGLRSRKHFLVVNAELAAEEKRLAYKAQRLQRMPLAAPKELGAVQIVDGQNCAALVFVLQEAEAL
jgi:hypothetical protein